MDSECMCTTLSFHYNRATKPSMFVLLLVCCSVLQEGFTSVQLGYSRSQLHSSPDLVQGYVCCRATSLHN